MHCHTDPGVLQRLRDDVDRWRKGRITHRPIWRTKRPPRQRGIGVKVGGPAPIKIIHHPLAINGGWQLLRGAHNRATPHARLEHAAHDRKPALLDPYLPKQPLRERLRRLVKLKIHSLIPPRGPR